MIPEAIHNRTDHRGRGVIQGSPVSGGDHRALRVAVSPVPAELPRGRGAHGGPRRDRLLRDDPAVVRQVRTRLRGRPAPPPTPTRRQVALRRGVLDDQRPSSLPVAGRRPGRHVLDILVQPRRDAKAAKRFFRNLPTKHCQVPRVLVTDKLRSYQAAHRAVMPSVKHRQSRYLNNPGGELAPADPPTRTRHETIPHPRLSPTVPGGVQRDLPAFPARRHRLTADDYRTAMTDRFATWNDITRSSKAA